MRFFFLITVFIYCLQFNHLQAEQIYAKYEVGFWEVKLNKNIVSDTVIYLKSSACIGKCKSYSLLVLSNGDTYLNALENMFLQGYFEYSLSKSQLKLLK